MIPVSVLSGQISGHERKLSRPDGVRRSSCSKGDFICTGTRRGLLAGDCRGQAHQALGQLGSWGIRWADETGRGAARRSPRRR